MASTAGITNSFKTEIFQGTHAVGTDVFKLALYTSAATMTPSTTTAYSATNEASGTGYSAGGITLTGDTVQLNTNTAAVTWADATWATSTISAAYGLIYNSSKSNKAVAILDFGGTQTTSASTFTVDMPAAASGMITFT